MIYDIIGDIHGQAEKLEKLLLTLGYDMIDGIYRKDGHRTVYVGDFIDRGPQNRRTIEVVRNMVEFGDAYAVMGNHEYNAVCYHTLKEGSATNYLRPHTHGKFMQHEAFLKEYPLGQDDTNSTIAWFKRLPLFLELDGFRVVHACWDERVIKALRSNFLENDCLQERYWQESADEESKSPLFGYIEKILKGGEADLPKGESFPDKDGNKRSSIRLKWWGDTIGNCRDVAFGYDLQTMSRFPDVAPRIKDAALYPKDAPPVFFGHYWQTGQPKLQQENVCCVDYSAGKGGDLICYQLKIQGNSPSKLNENNFLG